MEAIIENIQKVMADIDNKMGRYCTFEIKNRGDMLYQTYIAGPSESDGLAHVNHETLEQALERFTLFIKYNKAEVKDALLCDRQRLQNRIDEIDQRVISLSEAE